MRSSVFPASKKIASGRRRSSRVAIALDLPQRLDQILDQVFGGFEADGHPQEAVGDAQRAPRLGRQAGVRSGRGPRQQRLGSAQAGSMERDPHTPEEGLGGLPAPAQLEAEHPAHAGGEELASPLVLRVRRDSRMVHLGHGGLLGEEPGHPQRGVALLAEAQRQRLEAPGSKKQACGSSEPPRWSSLCLTASIRAALPITAPAIRSLWPFRYLVALCSERSNPCASGRNPIGVAKVLSMSETRPRARANCAAASRSATWSSGLVSVSK